MQNTNQRDNCQKKLFSKIKKMTLLFVCLLCFLISLVYGAPALTQLQQPEIDDADTMFQWGEFELIVGFCLFVAIDDVFDNHINYVFIIIIYIY
jgi:hypothetical protein